MNKTKPLALLIQFFVILFLIACEADLTPVPTVPAAPSRQPTAVAPGTVSPPPTSPQSPPSATLQLPAPSGPHGSITIAGVGVPSRELTTLPEFVGRALFDSLLRVDPATGDLLPGLAERWLVSEDARTFVFILRDDVEWHDGAPLTADDVVFTLQALSDPDVRITPAADFGEIEEIRASDEYTVSVTLREPYCAALTYIGMVNILPEHRLGGKQLTQVADEDLVGTGPLMLESWTDDTLTFSRNPDYWRGAPQIVNWTYASYPADDAAREAVRQGRANLWVGESGGAEATRTPVPTNEFYALALNTSRAPFDDARLRRAVAAALDRGQIIASIEGATGLETGLLPAFWAYPPGVTPAVFNAAAARRLVAEAGWRDANGDGIVEKANKPLEVTLWARADDPRSVLAAQLARAQLERVGIRAIIKLTERSLLLTRLFLQEYDLAIADFNIPLDPDQHYFWASDEDDPGYGLNVTGFRNTRADEALQAGNETAQCDPTARADAYEPLFQLLAQEVPMVFLFAPSSWVHGGSDVTGIAPSSFGGPYWNLNEWDGAP